MEPNTPDARAFGADAPPQAEEDPLDFEAEEQATPEEQAEYDIVVSRAVKYIHKNGRDSTLDQLSTGDTPAEGIGRTAAAIMTAIVRAAKQAGKQFGNGVLFHAGVEIVEELAQFGAEAGVFKFKDDAEATEQTEQGLMYAIKFYGEGALGSGMISPDDIEKSKDTMEEGLMREAEGSGEVAQGVRQAIEETPPKKAGLVNATRGL